MISVTKFIEGIKSIYIEKPVYELGHDGSDGKCDCIGMPRGALIRAGETGVKNMGGTNQAARKTLRNLTEIKGEDQLRIGDQVLKVRDKDDKSMPLPDRYRKGQPDYDSDIGEINFTHIGTVTDVHPLEITHMTSPTAKIDTSLKGWSYTGQLPWISYDEDDIPDVQKAIVYAEKGKTVKMRAKPSSGCRLYWDVPIGTEVTLIEPGETWSEIAWSGRIGYMLSKFLLTDEKYVVVIPGLNRAEAEAIMAQYPGSFIEIERG